MADQISIGDLGQNYSGGYNACVLIGLQRRQVFRLLRAASSRGAVIHRSKVHSPTPSPLQIDHAKETAGLTARIRSG